MEPVRNAFQMDWNTVRGIAGCRPRKSRLPEIIHSARRHHTGRPHIRRKARHLPGKVRHTRYLTSRLTGAQIDNRPNFAKMRLILRKAQDSSRGSQCSLAHRGRDILPSQERREDPHFPRQSNGDTRRRVRSFILTAPKLETGYVGYSAATAYANFFNNLLRPRSHVR